MGRLPLAAAALTLLLPLAAQADAGAPADDADARAPAAAPAPPGADRDARDANPANDMRPSGAQVLPLPPPDASTARGQERGNAALRAGKNPSEGGATEGNGSSGSAK